MEKMSFKPGVEEKRSNGCVQPPPQTHPQMIFCNKNFESVPEATPPDRTHMATQQQRVIPSRTHATIPLPLLHCCNTVPSICSPAHRTGYHVVVVSECVLTESAHARILSTDWTTARGTVATWRARRQTRVEPITVSALVPSPALAPIVVPIVDTGTCSVILTRRRGARFRLQQLTVGSRAPV